MNSQDFSTSALEPITGEPAEFLLTAQDNRGLPGRFHYWRGSNGHVFLDPVPEDLDRYYSGGYQRIPDDEAALAALAINDAYRLEPIRKIVPSGAFLEIGPWIGLTAYSARQAGYEVSVLERDPGCVDLLNRCGIEAIQSTDPAISLESLGRKFDVIGLWHSIEHLPRPWEVVTQAARCLNPGGLLVIAAPNPESKQFQLFGKNWVHLDAPRHIHLMPIDLVEGIANSQGLVTLEKTSDDRLGRMLDQHGWHFELHRRVFRIYGLRALAFRLLWRWLQRRHRVEGALDGAGYTLMAQRPPLGIK